MKIMHRIGFSATTAERRELEALGVKPASTTAMPGEERLFVAFDVGEDDPMWPQLRILLQEWKVSEGHVTTEFSKQEVEAARWLNISAWIHGYPQPELDFGYLRATYDLSGWCDQCGVGLKQKAPFQMKGEPRWGRNGILQMNWVPDAIFVRPEVWTAIFKPHEIPCRPVTNSKGVELKTVVQLVVEDEIGIAVDALSSERCMKCERVKYLPVTRGFFPALTATPRRALVKTKEYFGSGAAAHKKVLASQELARSLRKQGIRGVSFWPVQSGEGQSRSEGRLPL